MPRVKRGTKRRAKRKKILDRASGYFLTKSKLYRSAKEAVERGLKFAYSGRKQKKRQYRSLWIVRIGAAAKLNGMSYNQFIHGLKRPASSWIAKSWPTWRSMMPPALRASPSRRRLLRRGRVSSSQHSSDRRTLSGPQPFSYNLSFRAARRRNCFCRQCVNSALPSGDANLLACHGKKEMHESSST